MAVRIIHDDESDLLKSRGVKPRNGKVLSCSQCSAPFYRTPSKVKEAATRKDVFCSRKCAALGKVSNPNGTPLYLSDDGVKRCILCGSGENGFYRDKKTVDGLFAKCRKCVNDGNKRWMQENPERGREIQLAASRRREERCRAAGIKRQKARPEYYKTEAYKAGRKVYYQARKHDYRERGLRWRAENPERYKEMLRQHRQTPKAKLRHRLTQAKRRATILSRSDGSVTNEAIGQMLLDQQGCCNYCGCDITGRYDVDHIIPIVKGGPHTIGNVQLLCPPCNNKKRDKLVPVKRKPVPVQPVVQLALSM